MRKIITERKFDKLFDKINDGLGVKKDDGSIEYTYEENEEWLRRLEELEKEDYIVIGPRVLINKIKDKAYDYKLRHLSLGKVHFKSKKPEDYDFEIVDIPYDLHWQTDTYLLVIIRDYLRNFINNSKAIGNCVYKVDELNPKDQEYNETQNNKKWEVWKNLVNKVADEFDQLFNMQKNRFDDWDEKKWQKLKTKAFKDLAFIFDDLNW